MLIRYGEQYGLPPFDDILYVDLKSDFSGAEEPEADWDSFDRIISSGFEGVNAALDFAVRDACAKAEAQARRQGAGAGIKTTYEIQYNRSEAGGMTIDLGTTVVAHAIGNMI